ncbi:MAG: PilZ domain-containing protein [Candidatus Omnitrophica bacterium]|nr:PilZ domain-containing protein [Candidatus Omnitrophota bacterium]
MPGNNYPYERRDYERYKVDALATIIFQKSIKKSILIKDISARGVCGETTYFPKVDEKVEIILQTPFFESPVKKDARVAWFRKIDEKLCEMGLDFGLDNKIVLNDKIKKFFA